MTDPLRPARFVASATDDERPLRGLPANVGHESDTSVLFLAEVSRRNSEALVLSNTGADLDEDLTVTVGHRHDDRLTSIDWDASQSLSFAAGAGATGGDLEGYLVTATSETIMGIGALLLPVLGSDADVGLYRSLRWRVRAKVPAAGYASCSLTIKIYFDPQDDPSANFASTTMTIAYDQTEEDQWIEGPPINDVGDPFGVLGSYNMPDGIMYPRIYAHVDTEAATVYEIQFQWGPQ